MLSIQNYFLLIFIFWPSLRLAFYFYCFFINSLSFSYFLISSTFLSVLLCLFVLILSCLLLFYQFFFACLFLFYHVFYFFINSSLLFCSNFIISSTFLSILLCLFALILSCLLLFINSSLLEVLILSCLLLFYQFFFACLFLFYHFFSLFSSNIPYYSFKTITFFFFYLEFSYFFFSSYNI